MTYRALVRAINQTVPTLAIRRKLISNARVVLDCSDNHIALAEEAARATAILRRVASIPGAAEAFFESSRWSAPKNDVAQPMQDHK